MLVSNVAQQPSMAPLHAVAQNVSVCYTTSRQSSTFLCTSFSTNLSISSDLDRSAFSHWQDRALVTSKRPLFSLRVSRPSSVSVSPQAFRDGIFPSPAVSDTLCLHFHCNLLSRYLHYNNSTPFLSVNVHLQFVDTFVATACLFVCFYPGFRNASETFQQLSYFLPSLWVLATLRDFRPCLLLLISHRQWIPLFLLFHSFLLRNNLLRCWCMHAGLNSHRVFLSVVADARPRVKRARSFGQQSLSSFYSGIS